MVDFPAMFDDTRKYSGEHTKSYRKTFFFGNDTSDGFSIRIFIRFCWCTG